VVFALIPSADVDAIIHAFHRAFLGEPDAGYGAMGKPSNVPRAEVGARQCS